MKGETMTKLTINKEFLRRHLFVVLLLGGMGLWFGYDGFVTYPKTPAAELYESIEKSAPPAGMTAEKLEAFKTQKIQSQYGFCFALLFVSAVVGLHLLGVSQFRFAFDDSGFTWRGKRYSFADIKSVDRTKWDKKGILRLTLPDGKVTLDSWHHTLVSEFEKRLPKI